MRINHKANPEARLRAEMPSLQEQLDALWAGGQAESDMRTRINQLRQKYRGSSA